MAWFNRTGRVERRIRVLTAAATRVNLSDRAETRRMRTLRQGWQADAWSYRDEIGELRYAIKFLAYCTSRMKVFPAAYPESGVDDDPLKIEEVQDAPPEVVQLAQQALRELGNGKLSLKHLLAKASENHSVAGEYYLLGLQDPATGEERWGVRSVDEVMVKDDKWQLREMPSDPQGAVPWQPLDPTTTLVSRVWVPHPRFQILADSPLRSMLLDCESLLILRRMIRATGRSRLAGRGILAIPDELSLKVPNEDADASGDPEEDPFMGDLTTAMMEPIDDEGISAAVVPIVIRGPGDRLAQIKHIDFASQFDMESSKVREEMLGVIATSFDLPKEVIVGVADLNHWTAWQVDDNTFRHHVEPHVEQVCDSITGGYLRPYLEEFLPPDLQIWAKRIILWYDPVDLVKHPDRTKDALDAHDRLLISDMAARREAGFEETDAPTKAEIQVRLLEKMRTWPANLVMAFLHQWDPTLIAPPITEQGTIPGIKPSGVDVGEPAAPAAANGNGNGTVGRSPGIEPPPGRTAPDGGDSRAPGPPAAVRPLPQPPAQTAAALTAAARSASSREVALSRRLMLIDRELRTRLQVGASHAVLLQLERAGARVYKEAGRRGEPWKASVRGAPRWQLASRVGRQRLDEAGLTAAALLGENWQALHERFMHGVTQAQSRALEVARTIAGLPEDHGLVKRAEQDFAHGREQAWQFLRNELGRVTEGLLYDPTPGAQPGDWQGLNPDAVVQPGVIRSALAIAGGMDPGAVDARAVASDEVVKATIEPIGQIGTGSTLQDMIEAAGGEREGYEWVHGPALSPFEPHEELDGVQFANFDDDKLANPGDFPPVPFFYVGDHAGCSCDFVPVMMGPEQTAEADAEAPDEGEAVAASAAPAPPNLRAATSAERCGTCKMFDDGVCWGYGNHPVAASEVCDSYSPEAG